MEGDNIIQQNQSKNQVQVSEGSTMQVQHQMVNTSFTIQKEVPVNQFFSRNNQKQQKYGLWKQQKQI